jgi:hypothetical protein
MKNLFVLFVFLFLITSCGVNKKITTTKTHMWENKMVTKKEYDSLLYDHTYKFVQNYKDSN